MTPDELYIAAANLRLAAREKFCRDEAAYDRAIVDLTSAMRGADLVAIWRALTEASKAEYDLTGESELVGKLHDEIVTCECYLPGDPCAAIGADCEYCRNNCPLRGTT